MSAKDVASRLDQSATWVSSRWLAEEAEDEGKRLGVECFDAA